MVHHGASGGDLLSSVRLEDARWIHVTYTWDSASGSRRLQLNGDVAAESSGTAWPPPAGGVPRQLHVGRTANYDHGAEGVIDELSIWNTFSTTDDVIARLAATPALVDVDPPLAPALLTAFQLGFSAPAAAAGPDNVEYAARVNLLWTPAVDNVAVFAYYVHRDIEGGAQNTLIGNVTHASYRDALIYTPAAAGSGVAITYRVAAYDAAGLISADVATCTITLASPTMQTVTGVLPEPLEENVYVCIPRALCFTWHIRLELLETSSSTAVAGSSASS